MPLIKVLCDAILGDQAEEALATVKGHLAYSADPIMLITDSMIPAMDDAGQFHVADLREIPSRLSMQQRWPKTIPIAVGKSASSGRLHAERNACLCVAAR